MDNIIQIASVPIITAIVYGAMALYKKIVAGKEYWVRLIPVFCVGIGAILGIIAFYAVPSVMPADNVLVAILVGGASGLAATGTNQVFKQLSKSKETSDDGKNENDK